MSLPLSSIVYYFAGLKNSAKQLTKPCNVGIGMVLFLLISLTTTTALAKQDIDYVDAVFSVQYNNKNTNGENHLKITRNGDQYTINFTLDHWMISSQQLAKFKYNTCRVQPQQYTDSQKRPFKKKQEQQLNFHWQEHHVIFSTDNKEKEFPLQENNPLYDPLSFFFEARCALMDGQQSFTFPIIRKGRKRKQEFQVTGTELVHTPMGDYDAYVIERVRDNPKRQTRLYVAPELDYLLVKIEHQESPLLKIVATLKEMDYQLIDN